MCTEGMGGVLCGICKPNWAMSSSGLCLQCPEDVAAFQISLGLVAALIFLLVYCLFVLRPFFVDEARQQQEEETSTTSTGGSERHLCVRGVASMFEATGLMRVVNSRMAQMLAAPFVFVVRKIEEQLVFLLAAFLKNSGAEVFKVLISFAQVSGSFLSNYSIKWPPMLDSFLNFCQVFTIQIKALPGSLACAFKDLTYLNMLWAYLLLPFGVLIAISLPAAYVSIRGPQHPRYSTVIKQWAWMCTFVLFLVYPLISGPALENFMCTEVGGGEVRLKSQLRYAKEPYVRALLCREN